MERWSTNALCISYLWTWWFVLWGLLSARSPSLFYGAGQLHSELRDNELVQTDSLYLRFGGKRRV